MRVSDSSSFPGFERVYRDQFEFVWRTLRASGVGRGEIDDALQDVFLVVHRRLPEFEGRASIKTWVYEIARRVALRCRARAAQRALRHAELPDLPARDDLDTAVDRASASKVLSAFVSTLDEDRRQAFILAEFWDMPGREISEFLGVNMNTVYARLRSARAELDRVAHRMHVRNAGALTRALRAERPSSSTRRRAWVGIAAVVGKPTGSGLAGLGTIGGLGWGTIGAVSSGLVLATVVGFSTPGSTALAPAPASASAPELAAVPVRGSNVVESKPVPPAPSRAPPLKPVSAPKPPPRARVAARSNDDPRPAPTLPLPEQLQRVRAIRRAVRALDESAARAAIAAYRRESSGGSLEVEVDTLEVELACRMHSEDAQAQLQAFARRRPDRALVSRLRTICGISPQKPERTGTPP